MSVGVCLCQFVSVDVNKCMDNWTCLNGVWRRCRGYLDGVYRCLRCSDVFGGLPDCLPLAGWRIHTVLT